MSNVIELNHTFELYIPTQCICGQDLDKKLRDQAVLFAKNKFYDWFGGATVSPASGIWRLPDGTIADENVEILTSLAGDDSFDDYQDDAKKLAVTIADKLSQDRVLLKIDGKGFLFARSDENVKCGHNDKIKTAAPQKVIDATLDPVSVYYSLSRFASLRDARHLFCNVLNYTMASADLPWGSWKESVRLLLKEMPEVIADTNGFKIVHLHLTADTLKRGAERQVIQCIYQNDPTFRGLFVVSNQAQDSWELINVKSQVDASRSLTLRRMRVGTSAVRTATERIIKLHISEAEEKSITANEIQTRFDEAFDVSALTKQFFREISNWYFWAKGEVNFPPGQERVENEVVQATCVIRLITRLIFIWFLKEKRVDGHTLIPQMLFDKKSLAEILKVFDPDGSGKKQPSHYYKAILQNLFFATLNQPMKNRRWRKEGKDEDKNVYRYQALFAKPDDALALFKDIPFLNGGLFECLEQDQFSDLPDVALKVPDYLFFCPAREIDLNKLYGTKNKKYSVSGIIDILERYNFTVEENTPLEEEIALDPELLGKVFENLLASLNPETGETARKQTGSFYTPREIVNYMVDESLKAYLLQKLMEAPVSYIPVTSNQADMFGNKVKKGQQELMEEHQGHRDETGYGEKLNKLLSYDDHDENPFGKEETDILIDALHSLKVLDPACGSGAFPMGILHKMTHVLKKLDPGNRLWKERQLRAVEDPAMREHIERTFDANDMDFGRKLYLIQRCIYGVDIQPIAVQISKLRFFISLIVDQQIHKDQENLGILPLPNMETKFVAANTLIGLEQQLQLKTQDVINKENQLEVVRENYFNASNSLVKQKLKLEDEKLRNEIGKLLSADNLKTGSKISEWDPYDLTSSSDFFDPIWMFGTNKGFDICIGNPPYLESRNAAFSTSDKIAYQNEVAKDWDTDSSYIPRGSDLMMYFFAKAIKYINSRGIITFITQNAWLSTDYGVKFQHFLLKHTKVKAIIDSDYKYFDSKEGPNINTVISIFNCNYPDLKDKVVFSKYSANFKQVECSFDDVLQNEINQYASMRVIPNTDRKLKDIKWGILLDANNETIELMDILKNKATLIESIPRCKLSVGQGLNLTDNYLIPLEIIKECNLPSKFIIPIVAKDTAVFDTLSTQYYLVNKNLTDSKIVKHLSNNGYKMFDPNSTTKSPPIMFLPRGIGKHYCSINSASAYTASFVDIYDLNGKCNNEIQLNLWAILNSSIVWLLREVSGRKNLGGGMLKAEATDLKSLPLYFDLKADNEIRNILTAISNRTVYDTTRELESEEHIMIDNLVFSRLGISNELKYKLLTTLSDVMNERTKKAKT